MRAIVEWANTTDVIPNPLNPRKNDSIRTEEMQEIIHRRGWEEPLTVYRKGRNYVVLAGHRRLFAAKSMNIKQLPVYIVDEPENHQEEIERIASLQRGRVDWTAYEWAKFTYERWIAWNRPSITEFAEQIGISRTTTEDYIRVLDYFPRHEIEPKLLSESVSINRLAKLIQWMRKLKREKSELVENMTEEIIRRMMITKLENRAIVNKDDINQGLTFISESSDDEMKNFLTNPTISFKEALRNIGVTDQKEVKSFHGHMVSLGMMNRRVFEMKPNNLQEWETLNKQLVELKSSIEKRIETMKADHKKLI